MARDGPWCQHGAVRGFDAAILIPMGEQVILETRAGQDVARLVLVVRWARTDRLSAVEEEELRLPPTPAHALSAS